MEKIKKPVRSARGCEFGVLILVSVINLFTANNTVVSLFGNGAKPSMKPII